MGLVPLVSFSFIIFNSCAGRHRWSLLLYCLIHLIKRLTNVLPNMVKYAFVVFVGLAAALPLNINLGAYSPALVVGMMQPLYLSID